MALAKTRQKIGLKPITIADFCPLTEVNSNEESIQTIFKQPSVLKINRRDRGESTKDPEKSR